MFTHLSASDAVALLHAELGAPPLTVLDANKGPRALRQALAAAAREPDGGLLVVVAASLRTASLARVWFVTGDAPRADVQTIPVADGVLVVAHVAGTARRRAPPTPPAPPAWSTPDAAPVLDATPDHLDDDLLWPLLTSEALEERYPATFGSIEERWLARRGLLAADGRRWHPTVAGLIVGCPRPDRFLPGAAIECTVDGQRLVLRRSLRWLIARLGQVGLGDVDPNLLAEVVLNALLHRDWTSDAPTRLVIDGERVVVSSPGSLLAGAPRRAAHPNPLLVHFACALALATGTGRGLADVARWLRRDRSDRLTLFERDGDVEFCAHVDRPTRRPEAPPRATSRYVPPTPGTDVHTAPSRADVAPVRPANPLPDVPPAAPPVATAPPLAPAQPPTSPALPPIPPPPAAPWPPTPPRAEVPTLLPRDADHRAEALLASLRALGPTTSRDLALALGCSRPVVGKVLTTLVEQGRVLRIADSAHSPFQRYVPA